MTQIHAHVTLQTDNGGMQLFALMKDGEYQNPSLAFYDLKGDWKTNDDELIEIWDNSKYLIDNLYLELVKYTKLGISSKNYDPELSDLLRISKSSEEDLKQLLNSSLKMGLFDAVDCDFFT